MFEATNEQAKEKLEGIPSKWINTDYGMLKEDEALTLIKCSVNIELEVLGDYDVLNMDAFIIGLVKDNSENKE